MGEDLRDQDRDREVPPFDRFPAADHGTDEQIRLDELAGPGVEIGGGEKGAPEVMLTDVDIHEVIEPSQAALMVPARTRTHEQLAIDQLVAIAVVREGEDLVAGPVLGEVGHAHTVRSAGERRQGGIP